MIKIIFAPGCYGTYLSRCIYQYTNLNQEEYQSFDFDSTGSSHDFRSNSYAKKIILCEHIDQYSSATKLDSDQLVVILPEPDHLLDYYNNQFVKQEKSQVVSYILKQFDQQTIKEKLRKNWDYIGLFDETVPRWILREWFSFWIQECLTTGHNRGKYESLPAVYKLTCDDLLNDFLNSFHKIIAVLELQIKVSNEEILVVHERFLKSQRMHNSQLNCERWIKSVLLDTDHHLLTPTTIFDEAYIQHRLRSHGVEIHCDGLEIFPRNSLDMKKIIYKT